jgi:hypothetical protein
LVVKASDRRDLSGDRQHHVGNEKAQDSEARAPPYAARVFGHATSFHRPHLHHRILVEA